MGLARMGGQGGVAVMTVSPIAEVKLTVSLPDESGASKYTYAFAMPASEVRMADPDRDLPLMMERAVKNFALNLRFR
jgi:hypothetical protein